MTRAWLAIVVGVVLPALASAQTTPILASDIRAATAPNYGFDNRIDDCNAGARCAVTRLSAASPSGNDAIRIVATATGANEQYDIYYYFEGDSIPAVTQGQARFLRWRYRVNTPVFWPSDYQGANANSAGGKVTVLGNTCGSDGRIIGSLGSSAPARNAPYVELDENVTGSGITALTGTADTWHSVQYGLQSSSTAGATDGVLRLYHDNDVEGSPTDSASGFSLPTANWGAVNECLLTFGFTAFNALAVGGSFSVDLADFEYDDEFDSAWAGGGDPGAGSLPAHARPRWRRGDLGVLIAPFAAVWWVGHGAFRRRGALSRG